MSDRIEVLKTYKTYIGGAFPRSESGRYYKVYDQKGKLLANACRCSRKDIRDAVVAARKAFSGWSGRSAYNKGQILYRIAEILETRRSQFELELIEVGYTENEAKIEVDSSIDRLIYYAGWTDKYPQIYGTVNPVASSHFNFSVPEPTGVVGIVAPEKSPLLGLISVIAPVITGGNTCVVMASETYPLLSITFAEVLNSSDVPDGVVNILTGHRKELLDPLSRHMDVNAIFVTDKLDAEIGKQLDENAALNVKRIIKHNIDDWYADGTQSPYFILDHQEIKTTWHPVGF